MTKRFVPGRKVKSLPGGSLNKAIEAGERMGEFFAPGGPPSNAPPPAALTPHLIVPFKSTIDAVLKERSIVGIKETAFTLPDIDEEYGEDEADEAVLNGEPVDVELPDPDKHTAGRWGVVLAPTAALGTGALVIGGLVKIRVDVTDADHEFVKPKLNETDYAVSASAGVPMTFRKLQGEAGSESEGQQWAQVNLGSGGGEGGTVRRAVVKFDEDIAGATDDEGDRTPGTGSATVIKSDGYGGTISSCENWSTASIDEGSYGYVIDTDGDAIILDSWC